MHLATVVGNIWATRKLDCFHGAKLLLIQPKDEEGKPVGTPLAAVDAVGGAGPGETVFYVTAREAVIAYKRDLNDLTPVDAAIVGIVDYIDEKEH